VNAAQRIGTYVSALEKERDALAKRLKELESILAQRSSLQSDAMRMGQRQGRVELAQELVTISEEVDALPLWVKEHLRNILEEDSNE